MPPPPRRTAPLISQAAALVSPIQALVSPTAALVSPRAAGPGRPSPVAEPVAGAPPAGPKRPVRTRPLSTAQTCPKLASLMQTRALLQASAMPARAVQATAGPAS